MLNNNELNRMYRSTGIACTREISSTLSVQIIHYLFNYSLSAQRLEVDFILFSAINNHVLCSMLHAIIMNNNLNNNRMFKYLIVQMYFFVVYNLYV